MASCSIIRNPINKQIERVLAPNGQKSFLFESAVEHLKTIKDDVIQSKTKGNQNYVFQEDGVTVTLNRRNGDLYLESVQNENGYPMENVFNRVMDKFDKDGEVLYVDKTNPFSEKLIANAGFVESSDNPFALVRENEEFKNIPSQKLFEEALTLQSIPYTEEFEVSFGKWNYTQEERKEALERLAQQEKARRQVQLRNLEKSKRMLKRAENLREKNKQYKNLNNELYILERGDAFNGRMSEDSEGGTRERTEGIEQGISQPIQQVEGFGENFNSGMFERRNLEEIQRVRKLYKMGTSDAQSRIEELLRENGMSWILNEIHSRNDKGPRENTDGDSREVEQGTEGLDEKLQSVLKQLGVDTAENLIPVRFRLSNEEIFGVYNEKLEPLPTVGESRYLTDKDATDRNGEPYLKDVLVFDNLIRNWNATITPSQIYKLSNNFGHSFEGMEELYEEINKTFFPNGYFEIRTDLLFNSKLYSKGEAMYVLEHPEVQSNLQGFFERIRKEYLSNNTYLENTINNNYFDEELIQYKDEIDDLGKVQIEDPIEVENYFKENLAGISNREVFDGIVKRLDKYPSFKQRYSYDKDFANQIFRKYSAMSKIFRAQIIKDEFSPRVKGSRFATMYETLQFSNKGMEVAQDTAFLSKLDDYVWSSEQQDVKAILKEIETKLVDYNIDVIGLSDLYDRKNKSEFIDFLNKINTFTEKVSNNTHSVKDILQLSQDIDNFFGRSASYEKVFKKVSDANKGKTLVELTSEKDDLSLFEQHGLVKTSEGYYQKVSVENTLEEAYDRATDVIIQNPSLINGSNFKHLSFYKDGKFDEVAILDEANRNAVKDALKTYFKKRANELNDPNLKNRTETAQKWTIYKLMNKNPMNTEKLPNFVQEEVKFQNYNGNYHYLTNNFHSDFQNYILKNKLDNTELYKNVLKYFEVNENGISLNTENNTIKQRVRNSYITDQTFENLKQYSIISKNKTMQNLFEFENDGVRRHNAAENQRYYYSNNFSQMESFKGDYEVSGDTLVANNSSDNFIRVKEGLFEKVGQVSGVYVYGKQQIIENPNFNNYEYKLESPNVDMEVAREMVKPSVFSGSKSVKSYSKQEEDSLNQQHNECR